MTGDPLANECLNIYLDRLARSLASIINILDPDAIVFGGGLSNVASLYPALPNLLKTYIYVFCGYWHFHRARDAWRFQRRARSCLAVAERRDADVYAVNGDSAERRDRISVLPRGNL
jgi:predicted NBD/HSP70 family sugar kinase